MKLLPLYPRIIIERIKPEGKTKSGIIVPNSKEETLQGIVRACYEGFGVVKIGQTISYSRYAGEPVIIDGMDCLIINETDLTVVYD